MIVLCCYTQLHPRTRRCLEGDAEFVDVTGDEYAYWRAIEERWNGCQALVVVEHDVEVASTTISGFARCPELWCTAPYAIWAGSEFWYDRALGCAKFSAALQRSVPARMFCGPWKNLADRLNSTLGAFEIEPHLHGRVIHHHKEPQYVGEHCDAPGEDQRP